MTTMIELAQALVRAGHVDEAQVEAAAAVLTENLVVVDAQDTKDFALKDLAYQHKVINHAEEIAEEDLSMGDFEDRFVQAEVIESAAALAEKDAKLIEHADAELLVAFKNASGALLTARLIDKSATEAVAATLSDAWEIDEEK